MKNLVSTSICELKDDKKCAVTFTTDDALYKSCIFYNALLKEFGLKGTIAITLDMIASEENNKDGLGTWAQWQSLLSEGAFDVANHSKSHPYLDRLSTGELDIEINDTRKILQNNFPGMKVLCMANPYVVTNDIVDGVIKKFHFSARNGQAGFNSTNPDEYQWYHLNYKVVMHDTTADIMNGWVDNAITNHHWLIELWHGVDGQGWESPSSEVCSAHLSYLGTKLDVIWNGTMDEVTQYIRERQNAKVETLILNPELIKIRLETKINTSLFDFPLTLKTTLPDTWEKVSVSQKNETFTADSECFNNSRFLIYDAYPNNDIIISNFK